MTGCAPIGHYRYESSDTGQFGQQTKPAHRSFEAVTVRVSGYGTYDDAVKDRLQPRKRLLARRASQLDAYRNLAERVYGTVIFGSSTVNDFVLQNDRFRSYVDSYIRGAKIIAVNEHSDGVVETVMELKLEPRFRECVSRVADDQVSSHCPVPLPRGNDRVGDVQSANTNSLYYLD
ncbi:hypothetical protein BG841_03115 [Marinobacter sp. X15-166B]|nr:hypothetical protein BG841_03115 [Marinobacter sp. X15-166B]